MYNLAKVAMSNKIHAQAKKISSEVHSRQMEGLRKHPDTIVDTETYKDVIDYVSKNKDCSELEQCNVYSTTNKAIDSLISLTRKEAKKIAEENGDRNEFAGTLMSLQRNICSLASAGAFFSIPTKEIFVIRDHHKRKYYYQFDGKKQNKIAIPKRKSKKPERFTETEWLMIHLKSVLAHELFHMHMDIRCQSYDELLHEEYAYSNMVGWCRESGLTDTEIINGFLLSYGYQQAINKNPALFVSKKWKEIEKKAQLEAIKMIELFDNNNSSDKSSKKKKSVVSQSQENARWDLEF